MVVRLGIALLDHTLTAHVHLRTARQAFAEWDVMSARAKLVEQLDAAVEMHLPSHERGDSVVPPKRLQRLLEQAVEHQVSSLLTPLALFCVLFFVIFLFS
jgi:glycosyltransferase A (GT-A) superfamily protein (DUF2064 family)